MFNPRRIFIVRMHLYAQILTGINQFDQQRHGLRHIRAQKGFTVFPDQLRQRPA